MRRLDLLVYLLLAAGCQPTAEQERPPLTGLRVNTVLGGQGEGFLRAGGPRRFEFPADHGAHPGFRSEWWYLTAVLEDPQGEDYGVQFTLFRQALSAQPNSANPWRAGVVYMGHLAVTDVANDAHVQAQRISRGHPELAGVEVDPGFRLWIEDWLLASGPGFAPTLSAGDHGRFAVELAMRQDHPVVLQGQRGWSRKASASASYYYSIPRLSVNGTLRIGGRDVEVGGFAWLDREWSTSSLTPDLAGWDWFALQLHDGRNIMVGALRRRDGRRHPFNHGVVLQPGLAGDVVGEGDDGVWVLTADDFTLAPRRFWRDERGARWPIEWRVDVGAETFTVEAMVYDQVMDETLVYWEGIVGVRGEDGRELGRGYMELTGYDNDAQSPGDLAGSTDH